ncbi:thiamine phosphate synthase [Neisseria sp. N95_16]|uniref:Thiamine-phosphate synthase n=1 Tax=Neisseria brasiliensis TaxID=2666100 RepID=A0A5Q3RXD3_9NEIS|nr:MULTISPECIES: thiamine phosphate synthase [Neisseria]MRN37796.1 thiamine phosphate synthase [Neisseria brasiliensis]PJO09166.1 thiamine phosphate synthase [Neisseria sp. N95_16]PJO77345.1 thiamine phosphate synthase [Neisseria sp. N177_16]QGL24757.1 thiamine phosphate synthase [Neisseria brasiliensis]
MQFPKLVKPLKFYAVVPTADWVERMVKAGADTVQLRNKDLSGDALYREIERCVAACQGSETQLFINDHWQMAVKAGAYGVHLGQEDMDTADLAAIEAAGLRLGLSTHSVSELDRALSVNPSYVASGAIFPTTTKQMPTAPQGLDNLRQYVQQAGDTPVVAIGGIDLNNAREVLATGVASLAVVRAVTEAADPEAVVKAFQALWNE